MNTAYEKMKNFKGKYATEGAYHLDLKGFKAWFHEDNCKVICKWLGLDCSDGWLEKISTVVNSSGNEEKYSEEHLRTARRLIEKYDAGELFGKYMI